MRKKSGLKNEFDFLGWQGCTGLAAIHPGNPEASITRTGELFTKPTVGVFLGLGREFGSDNELGLIGIRAGIGERV